MRLSLFISSPFPSLSSGAAEILSSGAGEGEWARLRQVARSAAARQLRDPAAVAQLHRDDGHADQLEHVVEEREAPPGGRDEPLGACAHASAPSPPGAGG